MRQHYLFIALSVIMLASASVIIARCRSKHQMPTSEHFIMVEAKDESKGKSMYDDLPTFPETKTFTSTCYSKN
jgi:hypothetical protein